MTRGPSTLLFCLMIFFQLTPHALAATVTLPQTGQSACWDAAGTPVPCTGTGQDGELKTGRAWPSPRFIDNGDQTETDQLTGLVWSKDANPAGTARSWQNALDYLKTLNIQNFRGHSDWRLPNLNELRSLTQLQQGALATWLDTQGFSNVQANGYWSGDSDAYFTDSAWFVGMDSGYVYSTAKTDSYYVWPVRGGIPSPPAAAVIPRTGQTGCWNANGTPLTSCTGTGQDGESQTGAAWPGTRFIFNADQTVTDNLTGLIWSRDADLMVTRDPGFDGDYLAGNSWESANDGAVSWQHALDYIRKLNAEKYQGHGDWRLPNRDELASLIDWQQAYPAAWLFALGFVNVPADYYWSSSNDPVYNDAAWFVDMGSGYIDSYYKTDNHYVWPVRGMANQTITFVPAATAIYGGGTIGLSAAASSNLPVTLTLVSGPATLADQTLTITGAGTVVLKASQAGNTGYVAAPEVIASITVAARPLTITAKNVSRAYGASNPVDPGFTAPGLVGGDAIGAVSYSYAATATVTAPLGSTHGITPGNALFASGSPANYSIVYQAGTLTVAGTASQSVTFTPPSHAIFGDAPIPLVASASSDLPVSFVLVGGPATLANNTLTITGAGTITVAAAQAGNSDYAAASEVQRTVVVDKETAVVVLTPGTLVQAYDGTPKAVTADTTPAGLRTGVSYNGNAGAPTAIGSYLVTAIISDANFTGGASGVLTITAPPGDCDANGSVTVAEVQAAIDMYLGLGTPAACVDLDGDHAVDIAELQQVVNAFLAR